MNILPVLTDELVQSSSTCAGAGIFNVTLAIAATWLTACSICFDIIHGFNEDRII